MDFAANYHMLKEAVVAGTGQTHALLHVHAGLAIYVLAQIIWGTRRGAVPAVAIVAFFALINELADHAFWSSWRAADTGMDVFLTLFWPVLLMTVSKLRRWRWDIRIARQREASALLRTRAAGKPHWSVMVPSD